MPHDRQLKGERSIERERARTRTRRPRSKSPKPMRFITRLDTSACGWWVRVYWDGKVVASRLFSDSVHGGPERALNAAQRFRDEMVVVYGIPPATKVGYHARDRRNQDGYVGLSVTVDCRERPSKAFWTARFIRDGRQAKQSFSIRKYGYEGAYRLAAKVRRQATGHPVPKTCPPPPEWLQHWLKNIEQAG